MENPQHLQDEMLPPGPASPSSMGVLLGASPGSARMIQSGSVSELRPSPSVDAHAAIEALSIPVQVREVPYVQSRGRSVERCDAEAIEAMCNLSPRNQVPQPVAHERARVSAARSAGGLLELTSALEALRREVQEMGTQQQKQTSEIQTLQKKVWMTKKRGGGETLPEPEGSSLQELQEMQAKMRKEIGELKRLQEKAPRDGKAEAQRGGGASELKELQREFGKCRADIDALRSMHTREIGRFVHELAEFRTVQVSLTEICEKAAVSVEQQAGAISELQCQKVSLQREDTGKCFAQLEELKSTQIRDTNTLQTHQNRMAAEILRSVNNEMEKFREDVIRQVRPAGRESQEARCPGSVSLSIRATQATSPGSPRSPLHDGLHRTQEVRDTRMLPRGEEKPKACGRDAPDATVHCLHLERDILPSPKRGQRTPVVL